MNLPQWLHTSSLDWMLVVRLPIAALLGSLIGADRERLAWAAGLRTHMLVSVGRVSHHDRVGVRLLRRSWHQDVVLDPSRVAAQVVSGIGFLGAGSILLRGEVVRGLTTAASLWSVAAVGLAVGGGLYIEAVAATIVILLILAGLKPLEERFQQRHKTHELHLVAEPGALSIAAFDTALGYRARRITKYIAKPSETEALKTLPLH